MAEIIGLPCAPDCKIAVSYGKWRPIPPESWAVLQSMSPAEVGLEDQPILGAAGNVSNYSPTNNQWHHIFVVKEP